MLELLEVFEMLELFFSYIIVLRGIQEETFPLQGARGPGSSYDARRPTELTPGFLQTE